MEKKPLKPTANTKPKTTVPDWGIKKVLEQNKKVLDFLNKRK
ncbi:hypothetical protein Q0V21_31230 [Paenibacillus sp. 11B]|nr:MULTISPECIES: hypothetical protein [unclassified Paenibacillus]MDN8593205.1 hypothetical protein [Paenibacillus sp. 11B]